jgi:hypothetical protein
MGHHFVFPWQRALNGKITSLTHREKRPAPVVTANLPNLPSPDPTYLPDKIHKTI